MNADGHPEIWCGDAYHVCLFYFDVVLDQWRTFYRSEDLGAYPGMWNNLHPIKDPETGKTERLAVVTAGYLYLFDVDHGSLPSFP